MERRGFIGRLLGLGAVAATGLPKVEASVIEIVPPKTSGAFWRNVSEMFSGGRAFDGETTCFATSSCTIVNFDGNYFNSEFDIVRKSA